MSGQPVSQTPADIQRENKKTDKYLDKGTKIRPLKPTQADRRKIITAKEASKPFTRKDDASGSDFKKTNPLKFENRDSPPNWV